MDKKRPPDERVVYLALKDIFKGPHAEMRNQKAIKKVLKRNREKEEIGALVREHNIDIICSTVRVLLTEKVFESTLKAKIRFPEVFDVSPAQSAEREASVAEAVRDEAIAIKDAVQSYQEKIRDAIDVDRAVETETVVENDRHCKEQSGKTKVAKTPPRIPSLFPVYLPLGSQHRLLVKVQEILEQACFTFGQQKAPDILSKNQWDCPESAELNLWAAELLRRPKLFEDTENNAGKPLESLFRSVADIRHTAVHRIRVSARGIEQFIVDAESLATLLETPDFISSLTKLRLETQLAIEELEHNKHILTSKLAENLRRIEARRKELERVEEAAIAEMIKEDGEYLMFAGLHLERIVEAADKSDVAIAVVEKETGSDMNDSESVDGGEEPSLTFE